MTQIELFVLVAVALYFCAVGMHMFLGYRCERRQASKLRRKASRYFQQ